MPKVDVMLVLAVHTLEFMLVALATFVIYRVSTLTRAFYLEPAPSSSANFDFLEPAEVDQDKRDALYVLDTVEEPPVLNNPVDDSKAALDTVSPRQTESRNDSVPDLAELLGVDVSQSEERSTGKADYKAAYIDAFLGTSNDSALNINEPVKEVASQSWSDDFYSDNSFKSYEKIAFESASDVEGDDHAHMSRYERKMRSTVSAQAFAANQLLALNQQHDDLLESMPFWVCEAVAFYLIGATDFICKSNGCGVADRKHVIELVLRSNISLEPAALRQFFDLAVARDRRGEGDDTVKLGAFAAKYWSKNQPIPNSSSLELVLSELGLSST